MGRYKAAVAPARGCYDRVVRVVQIAVAGVLVACGPSTSDEADLAPLCGEAGPVQVLALSADEYVAPIYGAAAVDEDRFLYAVRTIDAPIGAWLDSGEETAWWPFDDQVAARVESVDRCGDDRRVVAEGFAEIWAPDNPGEPWLGYDTEADELWTFDPSGDTPARLVARTPGRPLRLVQGEDVFVWRAGSEDFVRITVTPTDLQTQVLLTEVATLGYSLSDRRIVVAVRDDGSVWDLDLARGQSSRLETEGRAVRWVSLWRDPRWVVWQPGEPGLGTGPSDPPSDLPTEAWVLDRDTGVSVRVAEAAGGLIAEARQGAVLVTYADHGSGPEHELVTFDGANRLQLDADTRWFADDAEGHHVVLDVTSLQASVYVLRDGAFAWLGPGGRATRFAEDALWRHDAYTDDRGSDALEIVRTPLATLIPTIVRRGVYSDTELVDGRWARFEGEPPSGRGDLVALDPANGRAERVAPDVLPYFVERGTLDVGEGTWLADEVVYQVVDDTGTRAGLWRARFEADD